MKERKKRKTKKRKKMKKKKPSLECEAALIERSHIKVSCSQSARNVKTLL
jgi:hypothetical protein